MCRTGRTGTGASRWVSSRTVLTRMGRAWSEATNGLGRSLGRNSTVRPAFPLPVSVPRSRPSASHRAGQSALSQSNEIGISPGLLVYRALRRRTSGILPCGESRLRLGLDCRDLRIRLLNPLGVVRRLNQYREVGHQHPANVGADPSGDRHGGDDTGPPVSRPLHPGSGRLGATGRRGMVRAAVSSTTRSHKRIRRTRPQVRATRRTRESRWFVLPTPAARWLRPWKATSVHDPPHSSRDPDLSRGRGAQEHRTGPHHASGTVRAVRLETRVRVRAGSVPMMMPPTTVRRYALVCSAMQQAADVPAGAVPRKAAISAPTSRRSSVVTIFSTPRYTTCSAPV